MAHPLIEEYTPADTFPQFFGNSDTSSVTGFPTCLLLSPNRPIHRLARPIYHPARARASPAPRPMTFRAEKENAFSPKKARVFQIAFPLGKE